MYDPTKAIAEIRERQRLANEAIAEYHADEDYQHSAGECADHYDHLLELYEAIAGEAVALDNWLSNGGELPTQWKA
ncbi:hypothetical protein SEA_PARTRIDGE_61 [Rhodococcus phage Partridge]|uniref:Uncharacterized protein n=4 Tax=Rerduovirus TaxID=1982375 RepID=A0A6G6XSE0_9CAUD|nr:HNH endonuclease [Rhodococcus phage Takoda]AOZ62882.1 hypothetical protein SEA_PARTRIDGE_61 [Rhodococcus phage Partridge]AQP30921.1 hypothetical protein SEA_ANGRYORCHARD_59 [Rhodococcus phage AngryOrchard]AWY06323.1 hypothetical protein PBI_TAKODA_62 [Rhodococcus phage Takoda]QIG61671.1 hypothetical protein SEA_DINGER_61 [Rhodococcus phage Dinger]